MNGVMKIRRKLIGIVSVLWVGAAGLFVVNGCGKSVAYVGDDCPVEMSQVCCVCMYDEDCDPRIEAICNGEETSCNGDDAGVDAP